MSADADQALWRAALDGDVSAVLHALGEHKLLRCVGGKEYSPAQSVGGTSELKRSFGGIEKHQHSELHGDEPPEVVHTKMSESILASNGSRLQIPYALLSTTSTPQEQSSFSIFAPTTPALPKKMEMPFCRRIDSHTKDGTNCVTN